MRPLILIWVALLPLALCSQAQSDVRSRERQADQLEKQRKDILQMQNKIEINYHRNSRGEYEFTCHSNAYCNYIIEISFPELQNLLADVPLPYRMDMPPGGTRQLLILKPATRGRVHFVYQHKIFKGCLSAAIDTSYTYLLPVPPGRETRIFELNYLASDFNGAPQPKGWYDLSFHVHAGDTVYAARRGRVIETHDNASLQDSNYRYAKEDNYIEIAHNDCSFGRYKAFRDNSIFVQPGDWIEAGQPIGIAGGDRYAAGPQIQFAVRYHLDAETQRQDNATPPVYWCYVPVKFWTKDKGDIHLVNRSTYTSEHPVTVITKEMTKKEVKKWSDNHKSS